MGASIGVALARNYIGYDPLQWDGAVTYTSGVSQPSSIKTGDLIRLGATSGARANEVYEYIGTDPILAQDKDGDGKLDELILKQDYGDTKKWKQRTTASANRIIASVDRSAINALDDATLTLDLTIWADTAQTIESTVVAGSMAIAGGTTGVALSGAGAGFLRLSAGAGAPGVAAAGPPAGATAAAGGSGCRTAVAAVGRQPGSRGDPL